MFSIKFNSGRETEKIGRLLGIMAKDGLISKPSTGKKWNITEKGETELGA